MEEEEGSLLIITFPKSTRCISEKDANKGGLYDEAPPAIGAESGNLVALQKTQGTNSITLGIPTLGNFCSPKKRISMRQKMARGCNVSPTSASVSTDTVPTISPIMWGKDNVNKRFHESRLPDQV